MDCKEISDCSLPAVKKALEEKLAALERELRVNLHKKHMLEHEIDERIKKIKEIELSIKRLDDFC